MSRKYHALSTTGINTFTVIAVTGLVFISTAQQVLAHHALGGRIPANFFEGFLSGLAHPVIGIDHLAFVVAIGLIAVGQTGGALIPAGFLLAALGGTGIHLLSLDLPGAEIVIALSVIAFGAMLAIPNKPNTATLIILSAIAGLFHGYAYGEAIVGAGMMPLVAYLLGFTVIQYVVAMLARSVGNRIMQTTATKSRQVMRLCGLAIGSVGIVFMTTLMLG